MTPRPPDDIPPTSEEPTSCPPQPLSRAPFTKELRHAHRWDVCLYRGQGGGGCYRPPRPRCHGADDEAAQRRHHDWLTIQGVSPWNQAMCRRVA